MAEARALRGHGGLAGLAAVRKNWRKYSVGYLFLLPAAILYAIFMVYPFVQSVYLSLTDWDGAQPVKRFVGVDYPIPEALTRGKDKVTVRFETRGSDAMVYEARTLEAAK